MALLNEGSASKTRDGSENKRQCQMVRSLSEVTYDAICILLRGQSLRDLQDFKERVQQLQEEGYPLTSLTAELRCPTGDALPKIWECKVTPTLAAKAEKTDSPLTED